MKTWTVNTTLLAAALAVFLLSPPSEAGKQVDAAACKAVKEKIRAIQDRMRSGYTASQGVRMDEQLRRLRDKRRRVCR